MLRNAHTHAAELGDDFDIVVAPTPREPLPPPAQQPKPDDKPHPGQQQQQQSARYENPRLQKFAEMQQQWDGLAPMPWLSL